MEPLCLPREPEWGVYRDGTDGQKAYIYGAEYQTNTLYGYMRSFHDHDVPCAVCLVPKKSIVKMFPGKKFKFFHFNNHIRLIKITSNHLRLNSIDPIIIVITFPSTYNNQYIGR